MSFVAAAIVVSAVAMNVQAIDAKQDAEKDAEEARTAALEAAQFAETEGEGIGMLGNINLSIDDSLDDDIRKSGQSNLSWFNSLMMPPRFNNASKMTSPDVPHNNIGRKSSHFCYKIFAFSQSCILQAFMHLQVTYIEIP